MKILRFLLPALLTLISLGLPVFAQTNSTWVGDGSQNFTNGNWSNSALWNPQTMPNGNYNVTIPWDPNGQVFNGPELDTNVSIQNLTLVNRVFLDDQAFPGSNLTITGTTAITTSPGHAGEYAALFNSGGTWLLGTLTNYEAATHTLNGAFLFPFNGATIGFRNADIWINKGTLLISGATSRFIDQNTNANAIRNLKQNDGGFTVSDGYNFTTAGNFTNNTGFSVATANGASTVMTISGSLTNFDAATHTLTGGSYDVEDTSNPSGIAKLRFPNADIRTLSNAYIKLIGPGASITDLNGLNALRNLSGIQGGNLTSGGTLTITPAGGTFTNDGASHTIDTGGHITIQGDHHSMNGGTTIVGGPTDNSSTTLIIDGHSIIDGGGIDMGGTPGVTTQYHTELQIMNGIEFRGAYLTGTGTTFADVGLIQGSVLNPGHSPGQLTFQGNVNLENTTTTQIQIGGTSPGDGYDQIVQSGGLFTLGGALDLTVIDGAESSIVYSDTFDIITSGQTLAGAFDNIVSGNRLYTSDGMGSFVVTYASQDKVTLSNFAQLLRITTAVSRKTHGAIDRDIPLNLTGTPTVECRSSGGNHKLIFTFVNDVVSGDASLTTQSGGVISGTPSFASNTMTVNLSGIANQQTITVTLNDVTDSFAQVLPATEVRMSLLVGDTSGNGLVNGTDISQTKFQSGHPVTDANFREDVVVTGTINSTDVSQVKSRSGNGLPPATQTRSRSSKTRER
jgi:hypothetical protein